MLLYYRQSRTFHVIFSIVKNMFEYRSFIWFSCLLVCMGCNRQPKSVSDNISKDKEARIAPQGNGAAFEDLEGKAIDLADFKGRRIFLNFWATWCRPCIEEMPSIEKAKTLLNNEGYVFLMASDQEVGKIRDFKEKKQFDLDFIKFNGSFTDLNVHALPATFIYDTEGKLLQRIDGATDWASDNVIQMLKNAGK